MILALASLITSFGITFFAIPSIIRIAEIKHLFDVPDDRKCHTTNVPTLGGLAIFAGLIISLTFWSTQKEIVELQYIISSIILLFFIGIKDDLFNLVHYKKLVGQLIAAFMLTHWASIRITSFFGIFGIHELDLITSYVFSVFTMVVITNAVNLIDGIDCLAGSVGALAALVFGIWFYSAEHTQYSILASSLAGSLFAFLYYNRTPAKIFMGDTGSLIVGIVLSILAIKLIEMNRILTVEDPSKIRRVPVFTISVLIIPLFDTLRVFMIRMLQGKSPFHPDRNHIHHLLIDLKFSHLQATSILIVFNILIIGFAYYFQNIRSEIILSVILVTCFSGAYIMTYARNKNNRLKLFRTVPVDLKKTP